jgi:ABC-type phosphate/phosphonate transport system ATPase subunit
MAVTISGLSKTYPNGVQALKNISLSIGNNMFGLLGRASSTAAAHKRSGIGKRLVCALRHRSKRR